MNFKKKLLGFLEVHIHLAIFFDCAYDTFGASISDRRSNILKETGHLCRLENTYCKLYMKVITSVQNRLHIHP